MLTPLTKKAIGAAAVALFCVTLAGCAGSSAASPQETAEPTAEGVNALCPADGITGTIKIGNPANLTVFSSAYMAFYNDMFKDAGLDVTFENITTADGFPLLAQGQLDMQMTSYSAAQFNAVKEGIDMQWVMAFDYGQEHEPGEVVPGFWSRVDVVGKAGKTDLSALEGRPVSSPTAGTGVAGMILDNALKEDGLTFGDVEMTKLSGPDALLGLQNGAVDAAWISAPSEVQAGQDPNLVPIAGYAPGVTGTTLVAGPSMLEQPQLLVAFLQVMNEAITKYFHGDWREDDAVVKQLSEILEVPESDIRESALLVFEPMSMDGVDSFLEDLQAFQIEQGQLDYDEPQDVNSLFDAQYVDAALSCSTDWMKK